MSRFIPTFNEPFLDGRGCITPIWRDYLRSIPADAALEVIEQQLAALGLRVTALEQQSGSAGNVVGRDSVTQYGVLSEGFVQLALVGDEPTPDPLRYYGTDEAGVRGYHQRRLDTLADVDAVAPASGQVLTYTGSEWAPATNTASSVFNYISADGDIYVTEDGADLYIGV